jgi:hypothetical protein
MTNLTNQHRRDAIAKSLEVYRTSGQKKTESIEYRGKDTPLVRNLDRPKMAPISDPPMYLVRSCVKS